jgi:hypothetical protein
MTGPKTAIPEILTNAQSFSSITLPTQGTMYPQICFRETVGWPEIPTKVHKSNLIILKVITGEESAGRGG